MSAGRESRWGISVTTPHLTMDCRPTSCKSSRTPRRGWTAHNRILMTRRRLVKRDATYPSQSEHFPLETIVSVLTNFELLKMNRQPDCFVDNGRFFIFQIYFAEFWEFDLDTPELITRTGRLSRDWQTQSRTVRSQLNYFPDLHWIDQNSCIDEEQCEYFVYFKEDYSQVEKRKVCRLLRLTIMQSRDRKVWCFDLDLKEGWKKIRQDTYQASVEQRRDCSNNISGPKYCDGIYYPR